jgi:hyperosmotically inducible protein
MTMKTLLPGLVSGLVLTLAGCASNVKAPEVADGIRQSLKDNGLKDVTVSQDREKGVVTLGGHVPADPDKMRAEAVARSLAGSQVVANQIGVLPPGAESDAKKVDSDLDQAIGKNLDAALIERGINKYVKYEVKNGVVTLTGELTSQGQRADAARLAGSVPNVLQVVNEIQVKNQRATSSR